MVCSKESSRHENNTVPKTFLPRRRYLRINSGRKTMCKWAASDVLNPSASFFHTCCPAEVLIG